MSFDFNNNTQVRRYRKYGYRPLRGEDAHETVFALQRSVGLLLFSEVMIFVNFLFVIYDIMLVLLFYRYHLAIKEYKKLRDFLPEIDDILDQPNKGKSSSNNMNVPTKGKKSKV